MERGKYPEDPHGGAHLPIYNNLSRDYAPGRKSSAGRFVMPDSRKSIDCRNFPSEKNCTIAISGTEEEVLDLAVLHAVTVHGHPQTDKLREQLRSLLQDEADARTAAA